MTPAVVLSVALALASLGAGSDRSTETGRPVSWKTLTFQAKKLLLTATAEVRLGPFENTDGEPTGNRTSGVLSLEIRSGFLNRRTSSRLLLHPETGATYERRQLYLGRRPRLKIYTYRQDGVDSTRIAPANEVEARSEPTAWTQRSEWSYEYPENLSQRIDLGRVIEPGALLYLVSRFEPAHFADGLTIPTFSSSTLQLAEIRYQGTQPVSTRVELMEESSAPGTRTVQAHAYEVRPRPIDGQDSEDFKLLGLEGAITLLVEAEHLIPLEVRGRLPPIGEVVVKLVSVELAPTPGQ